MEAACKLCKVLRADARRLRKERDLADASTVAESVASMASGPKSPRRTWKWSQEAKDRNRERRAALMTTPAVPKKHVAPEFGVRMAEERRKVEVQAARMGSFYSAKLGRAIMSPTDLTERDIDEIEQRAIRRAAQDRDLKFRIGGRA